MRRRVPPFLLALSLLPAWSSGHAQTAFRLTDLDLRDPHAYVSFLGCRDFTDTPLGGSSFNLDVQALIQQDGDGDGRLDLSHVLLFPGSPAGTLSFGSSECTAPMSGTSCATPAGTPVTIVTFAEQTAGTCLGAIAGTVRPYTPGIVSATAPCFVTAAIPSLALDLGLFSIPLRNVQIAARWVGTTGLNNGLLRGFLDAEDADNTILPLTMPLLGGSPISILFPGGAGNCATHDDRDSNGARPGWWMYFNFTAAAVPHSGIVAADAAPGGALELLGAPNPFRRSAMVRYTLPVPGEARLTIYDLRGRRVRDLFRGAQGSGSHVAVWDGRDSKGSPAAAGVYLVRLEAGGLSRTLKVARLN